MAFRSCNPESEKVSNSFFVTTSKAPVTTSVALVTTSFLFPNKSCNIYFRDMDSRCFSTLLVTSATLVVTGALLVGTMFAIRIKYKISLTLICYYYIVTVSDQDARRKGGRVLCGGGVPWRFLSLTATNFLPCPTRSFALAFASKHRTARGWTLCTDARCLGYSRASRRCEQLGLELGGGDAESWFTKSIHWSSTTVGRRAVRDWKDTSGRINKGHRY